MDESKRGQLYKVITSIQGEIMAQVEMEAYVLVQNRVENRVERRVSTVWDQVWDQLIRDRGQRG